MSNSPIDESMKREQTNRLIRANESGNKLVEEQNNLMEKQLDFFKSQADETKKQKYWMFAISSVIAILSLGIAALSIIIKSC